MNGFGFVFSFVIFVAGLYLMGIAFDVPEDLGFVTFGGGILAVTVAIAVPVHLIKRIDR